MSFSPFVSNPIAGPLGPSIDSSEIEAGAIVDSDVNASAAIAQSKIANLTTDLAAKVANSLADAKGDLFTATANDTPARLAVGTDGQVLSAASGQATGLQWIAAPGGGTVVRKTSDEIVNNSSTLQNDNELLVAVSASTVYLVELTLLLNAANATADFKFGFTGPASATFSWGVLATEAPGTFSSFIGSSLTPLAMRTISDSITVGSNTGNTALVLRGILVVAGTAGNLQMQWAQGTANASDSKVLTNSIIIARQIS